MSSAISHNIKGRSTANDKFYTPSTLVSVHLDKFKDKIADGSVILEPFYGEGAYYKEMEKRFPNCSLDFTEIDLGKDFFSYKTPVDYIISNPPYSIIDKVLEHSVSLRPKIISYLIGFSNITAKRVEYMNKNGYFITDFHITKVFKWYGMSLIITFSRECSQNVISFDRIVHK
jgi:hypothetical protein